MTPYGIWVTELIFFQVLFRLNSYIHLKMAMLVTDITGIAIGEVFRDEFLHWQQCEKLSLTYEEADSLIAPLVEEMEREDSELCDLKCDSIYDISKFYYARGPWAPFTYPKTISTWIEESCETEPIRGFAENRAGGLLFVGRDVVVPKDLQGEKYIIFDMNGKVLESGLTGARIKLPAHPIILEIKGWVKYLH